MAPNWQPTAGFAEDDHISLERACNPMNYRYVCLHRRSFQLISVALFSLQLSIGVSQDLDSLKKKLRKAGSIRTSSLSSESSRITREYLRKANAAETRQDYSLAHYYYQLAASVDAKNKGIHLKVGRVLERLGKSRDAYESYKIVFGQDVKDSRPRDLAAFARFGDLSTTFGKTQEATAIFEEIAGAWIPPKDLIPIPISPNRTFESLRSQAYRVVALDLRFKTGTEEDTSIAYATKAVEMSPKEWSNHYFKAAIEYRLRDRVAAKESMGRALTLAKGRDYENLRAESKRMRLTTGSSGVKMLQDGKYLDWKVVIYPDNTKVETSQVKTLVKG